MSPLANSFLDEHEIRVMEPFYPLRAMVCEQCFLVQLEEYESPAAIFSDYAYFSSYSATWVDHCRRYADAAVERFGLDGSSKVVEVASNDGGLLERFVELGVPVLGVEPAANVAQVAVAKGVPTAIEFFGRATARELAAVSQADLLIGNNVLAHVPDLNDFVAGMKILLKPGGTITMEFPHVLSLLEHNQFDTIYHEHFSYFSLLTAGRVFSAHGLEVHHVEQLPTHGGSLRIHAAHAEEARPRSDQAEELLDVERGEGLDGAERYASFAQAVVSAKRDIVEFFVQRKRAGDNIVGYGAPAKGNTLLNYCGVGTDFIDYCVDLNPHKQGKYLPGTHIPIKAPEQIEATRPDLIFILPWNIREEVMHQLAHARDWGASFAAWVGEIGVYT
jgi:2-polyprenyl-3-methyl-5-hydroxy-6-metoxy-1,4-benzoquinol methylase